MRHFHRPASSFEQANILKSNCYCFGLAQFKIIICSNVIFLFLFFILFIYLFYLWLCWVFVSLRGLSPVVASGGHSSSRCAGLFTIAASPVAEHRLQMRRLSSCGSRAQSLRGMWDPPRPGLEPVSPALAGRLPATVPPGKPSNVINLNYNSTAVNICVMLLINVFTIPYYYSYKIKI